MAKALVCFLISLSLVYTPGVLAQQRGSQGESGSQVPSPRRQMATIVYSGLGGLVLGLSTLSFYGRPQDHMSNIGMGFAIGVILGAAYTTYHAASAHRALGGPGLNSYNCYFCESSRPSELWVQSSGISAAQPLQQHSQPGFTLGLWGKSF